MRALALCGECRLCAGQPPSRWLPFVLRRDLVLHRVVRLQPLEVRAELLGVTAGEGEVWRVEEEFLPAVCATR